MIVRIFKVETEPGKAEEFRKFFVDTAIPLMKRQPGLTTLIPGLPRPETPDRFSMVMVWESVEALKAFAGEDWREAHVHPDEVGIVKSRTLDHYTLAS